MNNSVKRMLSAIIDFYIICFLSSAFICIVTLGKLDITPLSITAYLILFFLLLIIKDFIFKNASIGKRIFKIEIAKTDGTRLTIVDALKRTLPVIILLPIEVFLLVVNDKRIGDIWAKTSIIQKKGHG